MQEVRGSNPRLGGLRVSQFQVTGWISTLQSRVSGLQSTTRGNSIRTTKRLLRVKHNKSERELLAGLGGRTSRGAERLGASGVGRVARKGAARGLPKGAGCRGVQDMEGQTIYSSLSISLS